MTRISGRNLVQKNVVLLNGSFSSTIFAFKGPDAQKAEANQKHRQSPGDRERVIERREGGRGAENGADPDDPERAGPGHGADGRVR